jgi:hypothetical protein
VEYVKIIGGIPASFIAQGLFRYYMKFCNMCCITTLYVSYFVRRSLYQVHVQLKFKLFITVMSPLYTQ